MAVDDAEFVRMYNAGYGPREIADRLGVHIGYTRQIRRRLGLPPFRRTHRSVNVAFDTDRFLELYHRDMTAREIAEAMGFTQETVNRHRRALGLPLCRQPDMTGKNNHGGSKPKHDREIFRTLAEGGKTNTQISAEMGIPLKSVSRIRKELGLSKGAPVVPYSEADRKRALLMLEDGASKKEVSATIGVSQTALRRWFPDVRGWTPSESGRFRKLKEKMDLLDNPAGPRIYSN